MVSAWPEPASAMSAGSSADVRDGVAAFALSTTETLKLPHAISPFGKKAIDGHDAAALGISSAKGRKPCHRFGTRVDRLAPAFGILAAVRDQAPAQQFERALAGLMIFADNVKELARRDIIRGRLRAAVGHVEPVNKCKTQRIGSLNDTAAHGE
jgi:hypothetical protein